MRIPRVPAKIITTAFLSSSRSAAPSALVSTSSPHAYSSEQSNPANHLQRRQQVTVQTEASPNRHSFRLLQRKGFGSTSTRSAPKRLAKLGDGEEPSVCGGLPLPMRVHHLPSVGSTQDEARRILGNMSGPGKNESPIFFAVSASEQVHGRGTKGRDWIGRPGNAFITVCLPSDLISAICPITLLPLKVGTIVAQQTNSILQKNGAYRNVSVKWPNDVLIDDKKVAGVLIESHYDPDKMESWFLVGIGVNVAHAPKIFQFGPQRGRQATCLAEHCVGWLPNEGDDADEEGKKRGVEEARMLASDIAQGIYSWTCAALNPSHKDDEGVDRNAVAEAIVREWSEWAEFGKELVLRDKPGNEAVVPLGVELDGQLRVKTQDGRITLLCADYLL